MSWWEIVLLVGGISFAIPFGWFLCAVALAFVADLLDR